MIEELRLQSHLQMQIVYKCSCIAVGNVLKIARCIIVMNNLLDFFLEPPRLSNIINQYTIVHFLDFL